MLYRPAVRSSSQRFLITAAALAGLLALAAAVPTHPPQLDSIAGDAWPEDEVSQIEGTGGTATRVARMFHGARASPRHRDWVDRGRSRQYSGTDGPAPNAGEKRMGDAW